MGTDAPRPLTRKHQHTSSSCCYTHININLRGMYTYWDASIIQELYMYTILRVFLLLLWFVGHLDAGQGKRGDRCLLRHSPWRNKCAQVFTKHTLSVTVVLSTLFVVAFISAGRRPPGLLLRDKTTSERSGKKERNDKMEEVSCGVFCVTSNQGCVSLSCIHG